MPSIYNLDPLEFEGLKTEPLAKRPSKIRPQDFARSYKRGARFRDFLHTLPAILAAVDLRRLVDALLRARRKKKPILWGLGGHVIKVGLAPVLIDLMRRGFVGGIATTGAALIHDFEIALAGRTSEDVEAQLARGKFGMSRETGLYLNEIAVGAARSRLGLGEAAGKLLTNPRLGAKHTDVSLLAAAYNHRIPFTVHLAIGTDIFHVHPSADGAALGAASYHDFRLLCALVQRLHNGGVYLNLGSAVILPEVFLKALAAVRGLGRPLKNFTTANLDFQQHYRPTQNVLLRPARALKAQAISLTGPHELLLPLLAAALIERS
ncbi:deoxyhypusine synthase family protein [Acidobacteriia bacterium AH_259_A11_L15]|nr:deoxyhypusine synthase family protein [Acidobacteriia bacterium AH_259_A11_L15]